MKKITSVLLTIIMVLGLVLPLQASRLPELEVPQSFDFNMDFTLSLDIPEAPEMSMMMALIFGGEDVSVNMSGSVVLNDVAAQMYLEVLVGAGMLASAPVKLWLDFDLNNLEAPTAFTIVELPAMLRMLLAMENRELNRQFMVLDASEFLADLIAELPTLEEMQSEIETAFVELMAEVETWLDDRAVLDIIADYVDVLNFELNHSVESGFFTGLSLVLDVILDPSGERVELGIAFDLEITNINNAVVEFPTLTDENSVDLLSLF